MLPCSALLAEDDPNVGVEEKADYKPSGFLAFSGHDVTPVTTWYPELVKPEMWPKVKLPTNFNSSFEKPTSIWKAPGGHFASFDAGEFGGALFFAAEGARTWTKVLSGHVQGLGQFSESSFLAVGGLAHSDFSRGTVYLVTQRADGAWKARLVMTSGWGVPALIGESETRLFIEPNAPRLLVVEITDPMDDRRVSLVGFDIDGASHFLGQKPKPTNDAKIESTPAPEAPVPANE